MILDQRTFFSIIKLVFREKREFYLFYYDAIFKDSVFSKTNNTVKNTRKKGWETFWGFFSLILLQLNFEWKINPKMDIIRALSIFITLNILENA